MREAMGARLNALLDSPIDIVVDMVALPAYPFELPPLKSLRARPTQTGPCLAPERRT
jgi:hypothetical protein